MSSDGLIDTDDGQFPWEHVDACRRNARLQQRHKLDQARSEHEAQAKPCPRCGTAPKDLAWFYFESPRWTWAHLCGRAGWMTVCDSCHLQVDFFLEVLN